MLAKLLTLLSASKGAAVAAAVVLGAATVTVGASSPEVQDAVQNVVQTVTGNATSDTARSFKNDCDHGQPAVVAQRNAATKLIDATFQQDQKALEQLRGKGVDNKAAGDLIKTADDQLKDVRTKALNDTAAALNFGREGQNKPSGSPSAKPSTSPAPSASASPCPSSSPEASEASESPKPSGSPQLKGAEGSAKPSEQGRVTVADRTTLDANIKAIVDKAIADMNAIVKDATAKVGALPSPDRGGGKPSENPGNKPSGNPSEEHKPSGSPKP